MKLRLACIGLATALSLAVAALMAAAFHYRQQADHYRVALDRFDCGMEPHLFEGELNPRMAWTCRVYDEFLDRDDAAPYRDRSHAR
jgi:hypothetical protein